ncbi:enterotoxin [Aliivibrio fischeri ES114]|uniref:Enterotoxin n=1 Tax=Aliivibrio fischeri (strain ATCC 700601 / ES114) TaxID=312309 RepID=Q5DZZ9_ALIF1|nr:DUF2523 domain-containing protein [Aliivibrio fischeri]AAW87647.1 enterotoxin [Aliivibrio fischeri ES114]KLU78198.1 multidrug ABC transporter ATPase [Aliivibrio fischeri]
MLDYIYSWFVDGVAFLVIELAEMFLESKLFIIKFFWDVSNNIVSMFSIYPQIQSAIDMLPPQYSGILFYLGLDKVFAILIQALLTRFSLQVFKL